MPPAFLHRNGEGKCADDGREEFQMKVTLGKKILSAALCGPLVALTTPIDAHAAMAFQSQPAAPASGYSGQGAPQTAAELQALVAPIARYPDASVAHIPTPSTCPR